MAPDAFQGELNATTATEAEVGILMAGGTLDDLKHQSDDQREVMS